MFNREQMQEQLIRYSETVRTVDARHQVMVRELSDLTRQVCHLSDRAGAATELLQRQIEKANDRIDVLDLNTNDRLRVFEASSRTFWGRVRFIVIGG